MHDWQPGDVLLCVEDDPLAAALAAHGVPVVHRGQVCVLAEIIPVGMPHPHDPFCTADQDMLDLEVPFAAPAKRHPCGCATWGRDARFFRKLYTPDPEVDRKEAEGREVEDGVSKVIDAVMKALAR